MEARGAGTEDAAEAYRIRLAARRAERERLERLDRRLSAARGGVALLGLLAWFLSLGPDGLSVSWVVLAAGVFLVLVFVHGAAARRKARVARRVAYYEAASAALAGRWSGRGERGGRFADPRHPYSGDLDLFGHASLFERLCTARTRSGEDVLASWLLAPAEPGVVRERQAAVAELRSRLDLREDLAVLGSEARGAADSVSLRAWLRASPPPMPRLLHGAAIAVALGSAASAAAWLSGAAGSGPLFWAGGAAAAVTWAGRRFTRAFLGGLSRAAGDLRTVSELAARLEAERFESPLLVRLRAAFGEGPARSSREIARLQRLVERLDSRRNPLAAPFAFLLTWDFHVAAAVERWRARAAGPVAAALESLGEVEALGALAAYAFDHPADCFPELEEDGPRLEAEGMGHPLLPESRVVRNDVRLDATCRLWVVTGSNMSGKSTLLRALGLNVVLAQAGAPVRARELRLSPLAVGASIRIQDSLFEGRSHFYTEVARVRQILDMAGDRPWLLFLLDELFQGTHSADRKRGADAVVRTLGRRDALGLVTSHDLALAAIADDLAPLAANVHFEDHMEGDRMAFDYRLKSGPVRKSNALAIMRAVGLEV